MHSLRIGRGLRWAALASLVAVAGSILLAGCARPGHFDPDTLDPASPAARAAAAADYRAACAPCHGVDARGTGPVAPSLKRPPTDLTLLAARHGGTFPFDDTVAVIAGERAIDAHGTRAMPIWSTRLGSGDAASAVASIAEQRRIEMMARHLATLQRPAPAAPAPPPTRPTAAHPRRSHPRSAPAPQKP